MQPNDLERRTQRALSKLPAPQAPPSLLPRVMSAVRESSVRPWHRRRWLAWPRGWQVASAAVLGVVVLAVGTWLSTLQTELAAMALDGVRSAVPAVPAFIGLAAAASTQDLVGSWSLMDVTYGVLIPLFLAMLAASVVFGTALCRVARGGAFP